MNLNFTAGKSLKAFIVVLLLAFFPFERVTFAVTLYIRALTQTQDTWLRIDTKEDNFSVLVPARPEITGRGYSTFGPGGVRISEERIASLYHNGAVYIVRMYGTPSPKRLLSEYPDVLRLSKADESKLMVGGLEGKQYLKKGEGYFNFVRLVATKKRLYVLQAAARDEGNPDVRRFLSSLTLGDMDPAGINNTSSSIGERSVNSSAMSLAPAGSKPLTEKEVTRPAVVIYKPQPPYNLRAKQHRVSGTVKFRVVLLPSGEITNVEVLKGLAEGVTEDAASVVKSVKFLPAEKDGQFVPQYAEISYNFVIL